MTATEQNLDRSRYQVTPRVLVFVTRADSVLLLKLLPRNGKITRWTGRYNGLGGHIEQGEDALSAAKRELREESGLEADLWLCGTLMVDTGEDVGIALYVFTGEYIGGELAGTHEGVPEWIPWEKVFDDIPLVADGPVLLGRIRMMKRGDPPFSGCSSYDEHGKLTVAFG